MNERVSTGIPNLDSILGGGIPRGSLIVLGGPPGSGKTILAQQICFHNASPRCRVLYFGTLSEPVAKTLVHLQPFEFFDPGKMSSSIEFVDLDMVATPSGVEQAVSSVLKHVKRVKPSIIVIDSFKVLDDLAASRDDVRRFVYQLAVTLMAWDLTAILIGEYRHEAHVDNPLFSILDGIVLLSQRANSGATERFLQITKMRGADHHRGEHLFEITNHGIDLYAPRLRLVRSVMDPPPGVCRTGISRLDELLGNGVSWGSSILLAGPAGAGKTILALEFIYRGARLGEKGMFVTFEETPEHLCATARGMGWDLEQEIERGMIDIAYVPQPEIVVQPHLEAFHERVVAFGAKRIVVDSLSAFLDKLPRHAVRETTFHLCSLVYNCGAVGLFAADAPDAERGMEATVVDVIILLSYEEEDHDRVRYIEVYKHRDGEHYAGHHPMVIRRGGVAIFPSTGVVKADEAHRAVDMTRRMPTGVPGLDALIGGGLRPRSTTLVSGSAGIGKSTLATQFLLAGVAHGERCLYVSLEESGEQRVMIADELGLPMREAIEGHHLEVVFASRDDLRAAQFLTALTDRIETGQKKRIVLDGLTHMMSGSFGADELRAVLHRLAIRFKALDATAMFTIEAASLVGLELGTERTMSPVADNLWLLRYRVGPAGLQPSITVVKTRGSEHDPRTHDIVIGHGGMRVAGASALWPAHHHLVHHAGAP